MCKINGKKLGELRTSKGMTQKELAKATGLSRQTINNYEHGLANPSDETVEKMCFLLNINKEDIEIHDIGYNFMTSESETVKRIRRKIHRYSTPSETEKWIDDKRKLTPEEEVAEVQNALKNSFGIGSKRYILINPTLIHIPDWQRDTDIAKAVEIAENYSEDKFDPIKVYVHKGKLVVADGAHRVIALIINGELKILVEVLNCTEYDAILTFLDQQSGRKNMTVNDMYRAGIKANISVYTNFKLLFEHYNIQITAEEEKLSNPIGTITPTRSILRMVNSNSEILTYIIELIKNLEWCGSEKNAFVMRNFKVLKKLLANYGEIAEEKLLKNCKGAAFFESKVVSVKSNAELYDILSAEILK